MDKKRRKVEIENRQFLPEWTYQYSFILPDRAGALPVCLICHQTVAVMKVFNIKRHYETSHKSFAEKFPVSSELRKLKIDNLRMKYKSATNILNHAMTEQQKCAQASLNISWTLAKHMKPFTDANIVKECILQSANILFENKKEIIETMSHIPISTSTHTRNTEVLANDNHKLLKQDLSIADFYSLALDESCDITDTAQLIIYVRYLNNTNGKFYEELLTLLPLSGTTKGQDLYNAVIMYFETEKLNLKKIISVTTDGAPAMIGANQGLVQRLKDDPKCNSDVLSYHCIIHQSVLCCKLDSSLEEIMKTVMNIVNFIRAKSSLQHRQFKLLLQEVDSQFDDLLLHNNVRWLSKGNVLNRFLGLLNEIELFLLKSTHSAAKNHIKFIKDNNNVATIAFLADIFQHINFFNLKLQGDQKLICHLVSEVTCFCKKIELFSQDVGNEKLYFPNLRKVCDERNDIEIDNFIKFMTSLKTEFERRFADLKKIKNVVQLLNSSFTLQPDGEWVNEAIRVFKCDKATIQLEIIEFQTDDVLKNLYSENYTKTESNYDEFWLKYVSEKKYPTLKLLILKMCTMFGSTYVCESSFSKMNYIKNKFRSRLTNKHLEMIMKIACTNHTPNFKQLVESKICHFSH